MSRRDHSKVFTPFRTPSVVERDHDLADPLTPHSPTGGPTGASIARLSMSLSALPSPDHQPPTLRPTLTFDSDGYDQISGRYVMIFAAISVPVMRGFPRVGISRDITH